MAHMQRKVAAVKLDEQSWNFSAVEDWELVPATYYEYARESNTIVDGLRVKPDTSPPTIIIGLRVRGTPLSERFNVALKERIRLQAYPLWVTLTPKPHPEDSAGEPARFLPFVKLWEPWQRIAEGTRRAICEELAPCFPKEPGLPLLPFNRCSDLRDLGLVDAFDNYRCAEIDAESCIERLRVEIDWSFTDDQIRKPEEWTEEELKLIGTRPDREVAKLVNRSVMAVKAKKFQLQKVQREHQNSGGETADDQRAV